MITHKKINELSIYSYRKLKEVHLKDLQYINVFSGINNSGKTSVLEAIGLISDAKSRLNIQNWALIRSPGANGAKKKFVEYMTGIFPNTKTDMGIISISMMLDKKEYSVTISGEMKDVASNAGKISRLLEIAITTNDDTKPIKNTFKNDGQSKHTIENTQLFNISYVMLGEDIYSKSVTNFSNALLAQQKNELIKLMREFDENIEDIFLNEEGDIYIQNSNTGVLPLFAYGSGMQKSFLISTVLANNELDVIMIDEIDSALNISALKDVLTWFVSTCRSRKIQAFITTHNEEAIDAILDNVDDKNDDIRIITLRNQNNTENTIVKSLNGKEARQFRTDYEMELRI